MTTTLTPPATPPAQEELRDPAPSAGLVEVFRRRYLLRLLVRREISARYQGSFLGLMWSYLNPLAHFLIYYFIVGIVFNLHQNVPNFAIHIFAGLVIVHFFTETMNQGTRAIVRNKSIVKKMAMPREMFPVASMLVSFYHVLPQLVIMLVVCLASGWTPDLGGMIALALALVLVMILGSAMALMFSAANVFFRDVQSVLGILTSLIRFGVPMIYSYDMVAQRFGSFAPYYVLNPIADAVLLFQRAFWTGTIPDGQLVDAELPDHLLRLGAVMVLASLVILWIAQRIFTRLENKIPERL